MKKQLFVLLFLIPAFPIFSQTIKKNNKPITLGRIIVNANSQTINSSYVSASNIMRYGQHDIASILETTPGVFYSMYGGRNEASISINGFDIKHIPLFIDGIPVYVPYDGYPDLSRFTLFSIQNIEILRGLVPVTSGPNTYAGAINLVTKVPQKPFTLETGTSLLFDRNIKCSKKELWLRTGLKKEKWFAQLAFSTIDSDFFTLSKNFNATATENGGKRENSAHQDQAFKITLGYTPWDTTLFQITYIQQRAEKGIPVYAGTNSSVKRRYWKSPQWDKDSLYLLSNIKISDRSQLRVRIWYDQFQNTIESYDDDSYSTMSMGYAFRNFYDDYTLGTTATLISTLSGNDCFTLSAQYKYDLHKEHNEGDPTQKFRDSILHLGAEERFSLSKKINLSIGSALNAIIPHQAEDLTSTSTISNFPTQNGLGLDAQCKLEWEISSKSTILLGIEHKTRLPSMKDRYSYKLGKAIPNPDLKAEKINNLVAGISHKPSNNFYISAELFINNAYDFIGSITVSPGVTQNQNCGHVLFQGGTIALNTKPFLQFLSINLSYTYLIWHQYDSTTTITDLSHHKFFVDTTLTIDNYSATLLFKANSERNSESDGSRPVAGHIITDFYLNALFLKNITLKLGIKNLFDIDYQLTEGYPMPGRQIYSQLSWKY